MRRAPVWASCALVVVALARNARAQNANAQAAAEALFDEGKALMNRKLYSEACPKFFESNRLDQGIGTSLWLAECYEKNGQSASAWAEFREAAALAHKTADPREKVARARARGLEPRLARLLLLVPSEVRVPGLSITRDGIEVGEALWATAFPIDAGHHVVVATAPGKKPATMTIDIMSGPGEQALSVPPLEDAPPEAQPAPTASPEPEREEHPAGPPPFPTQKALGIGAAAVGVVSLAVGLGFGAHAMAEENDSNQKGTCGFAGNANNCTQTGVEERSAASTAATLSDVFCVLAGVGVVAGGILYFTAPKAKASGHAIRWSPWIGSSAGGVVLRSEFE